MKYLIKTRDLITFLNFVHILQVFQGFLKAQTSKKGQKLPLLRAAMSLGPLFPKSSCIKVSYLQS